MLFGNWRDYGESPRVLVGCGSLRASVAVLLPVLGGRERVLAASRSRSLTGPSPRSTTPRPLHPSLWTDGSSSLTDATARVELVPFLRGEERRPMSTTPVNAVLDAIRARIDNQPAESTPSCRHPPSQQSVLCLEDRTLLGCEFCGELLLRRPQPMPSDDVPEIAYEDLHALRQG